MHRTTWEQCAYKLTHNIQNYVHNRPLSVAQNVSIIWKRNGKFTVPTGTYSLLCNIQASSVIISQPSA